jgi:dethiobiotin synthetase
MSGVFVTATGTDIGKTFVTAALIRHLRAIGRPVHAIKPVVTGFDEADWAASDPAVLLGALGYPVDLEEIARISPWRFAAPLSPEMAGRREARTIAFAHLIDFCRGTLRKRPGLVLIEGIGGIMVPLDEHRTVLDWMSVLRLPVLIVTGTYVGTISHTLTALEVLARRNLDIAAMVVNESERSAASLEETLASIARFADCIELIGIPRFADRSSGHPAWDGIAAAIGCG